MDGLLHKAVEFKGFRRIVGPDNSPLKFIEFGRLRLGEGERWSVKFEEREAVLYILGGRCDIEADGRRFHNLGQRKNPFSGLPTALFLPPGSMCSITALQDLDMAVCTAPSEARGQGPSLITPDMCKVTSVGAFNWRREVRTVVGPEVPASRLLVGETLNPPGNWSSYPPHKHDTKSEGEAPLEEVYFFLVDPPQGFGIIRIYTPEGDPEPLDEVFVVENGDTVVIPRGYHPVAVAPGYTLLYLWVLAGEERAYGAWTDDPHHAWVRGAEAILREAL
ncbi:MAG TPA: 5-deoxy-glucuronate isomerase [Armatimonadetes bacterium]|nr:5-deoxy-glucuronate isomerase [Armatimonadota bacterium]